MNAFISSQFVSRAISSTEARSRGFTLIELMITVAIIGVLAAIAIPSYLDSIWKGKRGEAKAAIFRTLQTQERYYTQNNTYLAFSTAPAPSGFSTYSADSAANSHYAISSAACAGNTLDRCVLVIATVVGSPDPNCGNTLSMDSQGNKTSAIVSPICWN